MLAALLVTLAAPFNATVRASTGNAAVPIVSQEDGSTEPQPQTTDAKQLLTLAQLGYGDQTITATRSEIAIELPLRPGQAILTTSTFTIRYSVSPAVDLTTSSLTVLVNGEPRVTDLLSSPVGGIAELVVPIAPTDRLPDSASVRLTLQTVLNEPGTSCPPATDPQRWLTIRSDSVAVFGLTNADQSVGLSDIASLFSPLTPDPIGRTGVPVAVPITIVVGQGAAAEEFQAAGYVATAIGRWAEARNIEPVILFSDQIPADQPTIVVAAGIRFSGGLTWGDITWDGANYSAPTGLIAANRGLLALQRTATPRLLISSATPAGVLDAARALVDPALSGSLSGSYAIMTGRAAAVPDMRHPTWDGDTASFQDLGASDYSLTGTGLQVASLTFGRPSGWVIGGGARLSLEVAVTGNVSPDASLSLTLNGIGIGAMPIAPGGSGPLATGAIDTNQTVRTADFVIPPDLLNAPITGQTTRELHLGLVASLGAGATCTGGAAPSVTILPGSRWILPHSTSESLDLARFPAPLAGDPQAGIQPLMVVIPDWPTTGEQQAALRMIAAVSRWSAGDDRLLPLLIPVGRLNPADKTNANLIIIGTTIRNPVAGELIASQPLSFNLTSTTSSTSNYAQITGDIALLASPWMSGGAALLITSDFDAGVPLAASTFTSSGELNLLSGGVVSVGNETGPQTFANSTVAITKTSGLVDRFGWDRWWTFLAIVVLVGLLIIAAPLLARAAAPALGDRRRSRLNPFDERQ